ncbi:MAG: hypothetical protein ACKVQT_22615 [Burkholderiales bacterium]
MQAGDKIDFVPDDEGGFKVIARSKDVNVMRGRFAGRVAPSLAAMTKAVHDEAAERTVIFDKAAAKVGMALLL